MRIVIVEDNDNLCDQIVEYFRRRHHDVMACGSVAAAQAVLESMLARDRPPEAVICDAGLPDGDGVGIYLDFAMRTPSCRWVLMSGGHDPVRLESRFKGLSGLPAYIVVEKPIRLRVLLQLLEGKPAS